MKRFASLLLALILMISVLPVSVQAAPDPMMDNEDMILDYGPDAADSEMKGMQLTGFSAADTYQMADVAKSGTYRAMSASQKIIDVIKDFEGFSAKAYWDHSQWTVGYGTRASGPNVTVTRAEAEQLLRNALKNTYEPIVNNFCKKNGKQPTQQQFDAMLDLTYNVGGGWTTGSAVPNVVLKSVPALDVVKGFGAWCRSGGSVSYVHATRRVREALIYLYGEYYLAYGGQECKTGLKVVSNHNVPRFKVVIFKTASGTLSNGKKDYAGYYPAGNYYSSFVTGSRDGYTLVGWEVTKRSNTAVSGGERISTWNKAEKNLELTAVWAKGNVAVTPDKAPAELSKLPFTDVPKDAWYREAVGYVYQNKFMNGTSATTFDPAGAMTRGMLVTVLYRMDGSVPVSDEDRKCFNDIGGAYYTDAVAWAYKQGIVNGVTAKTFEPNRVITRQEAITIFYRYCVGADDSGVNLRSELKKFEDQSSVADFAVNAFTWAVSTGLVEGTATSSGIALRPTGKLNRAETAVLLQRCVEEII